MQDNLLLVEHKKGSCKCQDGPIFREFFFFFFFGVGGGGGGGGVGGCLSFINLVLKNKRRGASVSSPEKRDAYLRGCTVRKENEAELVH